MKLSRSLIQVFIDSDEHKKKVRENVKNRVYHPYSLPIAEEGFEQAKKEIREGIEDYICELEDDESISPKEYDAKADVLSCVLTWVEKEGELK